VRADTEARFTQNYTDIARVAGISLELKGEKLLFAVRHWIEQQKSWLLVLDNVDNVGLFKKSSNMQKNHQPSPELYRFVPHGSGGAVLWTSRDGGILGRVISLNKGVEVGPMAEREALKLFQKLSSRPPNEESLEEARLVSLLDKVPLAVAQAAAYIQKTRVSVQRYLVMLTESELRQAELLSREFEDFYRSDVPNSVMNTWLISMKQVSEESQCAETILNTIAFLDNQGLPFELLKATVPNFNEDETLLAASRLVEYAFLQIQRADDKGLPAYEQHRLVQIAARRALTGARSVRFSGMALKVMSDLFPDGTPETWTNCRIYLLHALKAVRRKEVEGFMKDALNLLSRIGRYYYEQGWRDEAEALTLEVLELRKSLLGEKHPGTIQAMGDLASTWHQQGRLNEAETLMLEVVELQKSVLGEKHPDTIWTMGNLASTWHQQGRLREAESLFLEVLELQKSMLGEKHPDTIRAMTSLASTWHQQGQFDEAEMLELEALELQKSVLGEKHLDTIWTMGDLATTWHQQGRFDKAEKLMLEVVELRKSVLGEKHPHTIWAMASLASTWHQQGRIDETETLELEVGELRKSVLGEKHPGTIQAMGNLASKLHQQGRLEEAETFELECLEL
jgi:tetratricopeptide (TPR) repeat protein